MRIFRNKIIKKVHEVNFFSFTKESIFGGGKVLKIKFKLILEL